MTNKKWMYVFGILAMILILIGLLTSCNNNTESKPQEIIGKNITIKDSCGCNSRIVLVSEYTEDTITYKIFMVGDNITVIKK